MIPKSHGVTHLIVALALGAAWVAAAQTQTPALVTPAAPATPAGTATLRGHVYDPTNALIARDRHIRTALGRDYADVPPTRGLFRGRTDSELYVAVQVTSSDAAPDLDRELPIPEDWSMLVEKAQAPPPPAEPLLQIQQSQQ